MKILVFGGAGFIGHHLVNQLQHKHDICVYDNFTVFGLRAEYLKRELIQKRTQQWINVETVSGSVVENSLIQHTFASFKPDVVVNLAAYPRVSLSEKYPVLSAEGMIQGLINTMNYPIKKYVHVSSSNVYGNYQDDADESSLCAPINLYGSLKLTQEYLIKSNAKIKRFAYNILRPICVFGNYDVGDRLVSKFIKQAINNEDIFYAQDTTTDITYVSDMIQAMQLSIESNVDNETFNVSSEHTVTLKQLAEHIVSYYKSNSKMIPVSREKYFPNRGSLKIDKLKNLLNYERQFDLHKALEHLDAGSIY
jgi:nucleoside-diphosphate-sugar epimerase